MKASRLLTLLLLLQTRQRMTTGELALRLEVSRRTVLRDVEALSAAGVPVYAERGRHGGIVLLPGSRLNASNLEPAEMEALSVSGLDSWQREQLGVAAAYEMAAHKIAARRVAAAEPKVGLADLVVVDNASWFAPAGQATEVGALALDLRNRRRLRVKYRHSGAALASTAIVDPYGMASKAGRWYLVADQELEPRLFNLDRLETYEVLPDPTRAREGQDLDTVWEYLMYRTEDPGQITVTARLHEDRVDLAKRLLGSRFQIIGPAEGSWCPVEVRYSNIESVRQLLQFGNHIEVIAPVDARRRILQIASDLAKRHLP